MLSGACFFTLVVDVEDHTQPPTCPCSGVQGVFSFIFIFIYFHFWRTIILLTEIPGVGGSE